MKIVHALILCAAFTGTYSSAAQEIHDVKKDPAILDGYLAALTEQRVPYFVALCTNNSINIIEPLDSITINRFLSTVPLKHRTVLVTGSTDLQRLNNLQETVLVYGPRSMQPLLAAYVPQHADSKRRGLTPWLSSTLVNSFGFSPYHVAYGRWSMPYVFKSFESHPNSLPFYMTQTNTNKYLLADR